jgi:hypothetical protein
LWQNFFALKIFVPLETGIFSSYIFSQIMIRAGAVYVVTR